MENFGVQFFGGLCGGAAIGGAILSFMVWYIKKEIDKADKRREADLETRRERFIAESEYRHSLGRLVFWLFDGVQNYESATNTEYWDGHLKKGYEEFQKSEEVCRQIDQRQLAAANEKG